MRNNICSFCILCIIAALLIPLKIKDIQIEGYVQLKSYLGSVGVVLRTQTPTVSNPVHEYCGWEVCEHFGYRPSPQSHSDREIFEDPFCLPVTWIIVKIISNEIQRQDTCHACWIIRSLDVKLSVSNVYQS